VSSSIVVGNKQNRTLSLRTNFDIFVERIYFVLQTRTVVTSQLEMLWVQPVKLKVKLVCLVVHVGTNFQGRLWTSSMEKG